jgi:hypothetical protein
MNHIDKNNPYKHEVKERWGDTDAYKEYKERGADHDKAIRLLDAVMEGFAELNRDGISPNSEPAKMQVTKLRQCITDNFYTCTNEILSGLGQMYVADERFRNNINKHGEGTAEYISECIKACC